MNKYVAIYKGKEIVVEAKTLYAAKLAAIEMLKVRKSQQHMVSVLLVEKANGEEVIHVADF